MTVGTGPAGRARHPDPARTRPGRPPRSCSCPAPDRWTGTRRSAATSRSKTSPGAWPAAASRSCASTRSPTPTDSRRPGSPTSPSTTSTCTTRPPPRNCSASSQPSTRRRVFLLGHSLGGTVRPARRRRRTGRRRPGPPGRRGAADALGRGPPVPLPRARWTRPPPTASQPIIDAMTRQAQTVDSPDLSAATPPHDLPFGVPAAYWLDLRGYDPAATRRDARQADADPARRPRLPGHRRRRPRPMAGRPRRSRPA